MGRFVINEVFHKGWSITEEANGKAGSLRYELFDLKETEFHGSVLGINFNVVDDEEIINTLNLNFQEIQVIEEHLDGELEELIPDNLQFNDKVTERGDEAERDLAVDGSAEEDEEEEEPETEDEFNREEHFDGQPPAKRSRIQQEPIAVEENIDSMTYNDDLGDREEPMHGQDEAVNEPFDAEADIFPPIILAEGESLATAIFNRYTPHRS